jgi:hypothetical protein
MAVAASGVIRKRHGIIEGVRGRRDVLRCMRPGARSRGGCADRSSPGERDGRDPGHVGRGGRAGGVDCADCAERRAREQPFCVRCLLCAGPSERPRAGPHDGGDDVRHQRRRKATDGGPELQESNGRRGEGMHARRGALPPFPDVDAGHPDRDNRLRATGAVCAVTPLRADLFVRSARDCGACPRGAVHGKIHEHVGLDPKRSADRR